jgi:hypothetical protein
MPHQPVTHFSAREEAQERVEGERLAFPPSAELRVERSRFSRFLARFGLGELTDPILRPTKRPAERGHTG